MHSIRELAGAADAASLLTLARCCFEHQGPLAVR